ncbi:hypothetical protein M011DRAFT_479185 [Sporormia fimetaria CBS 119925]|uniref:Pheromone-regulated membrane protein n=1 Tax=Sporormia fimetaria CBS 119925 TaxID=1340428 RepID=A0A6A6V780_9PLEO|nr:hypothetical protein M011DRAFT_479185 [Sporormia fimetaria CBS 119925]
MGCCGDREKALVVEESQKWDYLNLDDFKSRHCLTPLSYVWLWILVIVSIAVYAADAFTAVNLLAFNKWSGIKPVIPFDVAKWIFAVCIILSYVFLGYRWLRAFRVMRSGSVTECYLEPLAVIFQSVRVGGRSQGWRRFLVFAELTRSKKGVDYLALFTYFQFKGALLIILAQGPRMVINALTLWAVMQAELIPVGEHAAPKDRAPFVQFFMNIETMTKEGNTRETIIYFTMLFSLVIWVIAALSLLLSVIFYVFFLWHYIPSADGTLTKYCRRKIETRLERVVSKKVKQALEKENEKRRKDEARMAKKADEGPAHRAPTLPKLQTLDDDAASVTTTTTLPPYSALSRSDTMQTSTTGRTPIATPSLPSLSERPVPSRSDTTLTYESDSPLLNHPGGMGMSSPVPPMPPTNWHGDQSRGGSGRRPPMRQYTPLGQDRPYQQRGPLPPVDTSYPSGRNSPSAHIISPLSNDGRPYDMRSPMADPTFSPYDRNRRGGPSYEMSPVDVSPVGSYPQDPDYDTYAPPRIPNALRAGSHAQTSGVNSSRTSPPPSRVGTAPPNNPRAGIPAALQSAIQRREASQPLPPRGPSTTYQQQSATAPIRPPEWGHEESYRSNTTSPGAGGYRGDYDDGYQRGYQGGYQGSHQGGHQGGYHGY